MSKLSRRIVSFFLRASWLISLFTFVSTGLTLALYLGTELTTHSNSREWLEFYISPNEMNSPALEKLIDEEQRRTNISNVRIVCVSFPDTTTSCKSDKCPAATAEPATISDAPDLAVFDVRQVRVNNLANLEALLNLGTNAFEIITIERGLFLLAAALMSTNGKGKPFALGLILIVIGLALPGVISLIIFSAGDANLFS